MVTVSESSASAGVFNGVQISAENEGGGITAVETKTKKASTNLLIP
jgi:hypothetical protein